ncbi:hypothetical protein V6N13_090263 [Hibiscus sabdariffa]|uniref:Uncharacterized protein n=1 Tax=Hibiscus sabdariffa TaxID=183260 RepID=A0ABR2C0U3_9ROSI
MLGVVEDGETVRELVVIDESIAVGVTGGAPINDVGVRKRRVSEAIRGIGRERPRRRRRWWVLALRIKEWVQRLSASSLFSKITHDFRSVSARKHHPRCFI